MLSPLPMFVPLSLCHPLTLPLPQCAKEFLSKDGPRLQWLLKLKYVLLKQGGFVIRVESRILCFYGAVCLH